MHMYACYTVLYTGKWLIRVTNRSQCSGPPLPNEPRMAADIIQTAFAIFWTFFTLWQFNWYNTFQFGTELGCMRNVFLLGQNNCDGTERTASNSLLEAKFANTSDLTLKHTIKKILHILWVEFYARVFGCLALFWEELINRGFFCNGQVVARKVSKCINVRARIRLIWKEQQLFISKYVSWNILLAAGNKNWTKYKQKIQFESIDNFIFICVYILTLI